MSIPDILHNEDLNTEEKLKQISEYVNTVRKNYGNLDVTFTVPVVNTVEGLLPITALENKSKLQLVSKEVEDIFKETLAYTEQVEGSVASKKVEELISTSPLLASLDSEPEFKV